MKFIPAAVSIALKKQEEGTMETDDNNYDVVFNPSLKDEEDAFATMTFTFDGAKGQLVSSHSVGTISTSQYEHCLAAARGASQSVVRFFRDCVSKKLSADLR